MHEKNVPNVPLPLNRMDGLKDQGSSILEDSFRTDTIESNVMTPKRLVDTD